MKKRIYMAKEIRGSYEENVNLFCAQAVREGWQVQEMTSFENGGRGTIVILFYKEVEQ